MLSNNRSHEIRKEIMGVIRVTKEEKKYGFKNNLLFLLFFILNHNIELPLYIYIYFKEIES